MDVLKDYAAVVTGAGGGIGLGVVKRYVEEGARVVAADISADKVDALSDHFGRDAVVPVIADVAQAAGNRRLVELAVQHFGKLDVFVANAGIYDFCMPVTEMSDEQISRGFDEIFEINVKSVLFAAAASFEALRRSRGSMILTASFASSSTAGGGVLYTASKHAVAGVIKQLAYEWAPDVRVNGVAPGIAPTALRGLNALGQESHSSIIQGAEKIIPLQEIPLSDAYGGLFALLASRRDAGHITGSMMTADSGLAIRGMTQPGGLVHA